MSLSVLFGPLQDLLGKFQSERHYTDEKRDSALLAINKALIETKRYIEVSESAHSFDRNQEYALAELAERLQNKSLYWSEEFKWSREEVLSRQIDIDSIHDEVLALLKK